MTGVGRVGRVGVEMGALRLMGNASLDGRDGGAALDR